MKILKCGCGYEESADLFDFEYHNNDGCGNDYIYCTKCEKVYIVIDEFSSKERWDKISEDAEQFGGIKECEVVVPNLDINEVSSIEEAEKFYEGIVQEIKKGLKMSPFVEIYGDVTCLIRYLSFDKQASGAKNSIIINEFFETLNAWLPTGRFYY